MKIMVVDDFRADREAVCGLLRSFTGMGLTIAAECESGEEALEVLGEARPDIVVSDMEMPFMNGAEFAALARERMPDVRFIFCSLYDRFDYVQNAFRVGGDGYILKPVNPEELRGQLERTIGELRDRERLRKENARLTEFVEQNAPMLLEILYADLIFGRTTPEGAREKSETLGGGPLDGSFGLAVLEVDHYAQTARLPEFGSGTMLSLMVRRELDYGLEGRRDVHTVRLDDSHYGIVFRLPGEEDGRAGQLMYAVCETLMKRLRGDGISVTAALSEAVRGAQGLNRCYEQCQQLLDYKIILGRQCIITPAESFLSRQTPRVDISAMQKDVRFLLNTGDSTAIREYVEGLYAGASDAGTPRMISYCLLICIQLVLGESNEDLSCASIEERLIWDKLSRFETIPDVSMLFLNLMTAYAGVLEKKFKNDRSSFIARVCAYIQQMDFACASIESISSHFFYSPNYLNRVFKEETGKTILEYLTECRMERAKELLRSPQAKLADVAAGLGYSQATYFNHVFKRHCGISPREYRDQAKSGGI